MEQDYGYLDHSENVTDTIGNSQGFIADTEDDIAYVGRFLLEKNAEYQNFTVRVEAYNTTTEEDFTLKQISFNFSSVQYSNDGRYLLNESQSVIGELQTTNVKSLALLTLDPTLDTVTHYGVKIYMPILLNWRYWMPKQGVNVDFYPDQNENWQQYNDLGDWIIRTELELLQDGLAYTHANDLIVNDYDADDNITSEIKVFLQPSNLEVSAITENSQFILQSTHELVTGTWETAKVWGELTVEPYEQQPRFNSSTVVDYDGNVSAPLAPISGNLIELTFPATNIAKMRYLFDSSKINLSNGVSFSAKIKEKDLPEPDYPINTFDDAKVAYSFRKVSSDNVYSHLAPCIRVQSDDDLTDIYFTYVNGVLVLDVASLLYWAKARDVTVHTLYDQSGNGNNAVQDSNSFQALIVDAGVMVTDSNLGLPMMDSKGNPVYYNIDVPFATTQLMYQSFVFDRISNDYTIGLGSSDYSPTSFRLADSDSVDTFMGATMQNHGTDSSSGLLLSTVLRDSSDNVKVWIGATSYTTINSPNVVANFEYLGRRKSLIEPSGWEDTDFGFSELIYWAKDKEAEKATIDILTNTFYGL